MLYSLTSADNSYEIRDKDFVVSCNKFGVDLPYPFIIKNDTDSALIKK
jgi:hypothetical protein